MVAYAQEEAVVVAVFGASAHLYLLQFLLETVGGVVETLEDTCYGRDIIILALHAVGVVVHGFAFFLLGVGGHEHLVGISSQREAVVLVEGDGEVKAQSQVGWDELCIVIAAIAYLRTDIVDVQTYADATLAIAKHHIIIVVHGDIGCEGFAWRRL